MEKGISSLLGVLRRRSLPAALVFSAAIGGAIAYLAVTPRLYETSARVMLDDKRVSVSELGRDLTQSASGGSPEANQAELVKSQRVLKRAIAIAFPQDRSNSSQSPITSDELSGGLNVKIVPATNILEIIYQSEDPKLVALLLNAVSQAMVEDNIKAISSEATKVRAFLQKELPKVRTQLLQAEAAENNFRQQSGIISYESQTNSLVQSIASLEDQERTLSSQLREIKSRDASLRQITDTGTLSNAYANVRGGQDEELKSLRTKLAELETQLIEARLRFTDEHPNVTKLLGQRDATRALYTDNLARVSPSNQAIPSNNVAGDALSQDLTSKLILNEIEGLAVENKLRLLQAKQAELQTRLTELPMQQQPLNTITRRREEAAASLKFLQSKLEEARITEAQKVSSIQIIEEAKPPTSPTSPKQSVVLALAATFGSVLAVGVMLLLEMMDNTLRDAGEAEELLQLPLLGVLPRLPGKTLVLEPANRFLDDVGLVEPYRMLLKTLEFRSPEQLRLIVVSSTMSGEGKSVVASHLAAVSAMLSWRTLVIDADLRRPVQHILFNLDPKLGITDVIEGSKSLQEAVQPTDVQNLDVLTCGELYGRPSQFLESAGMKSLLAEAAEKYDVVIIDTPPLSASADAATLARQSDGVVLVTRPGFTLKEILLRSVTELTRNRIPILGVVVNGMTSQTEQYYRYPVDGYQPRLPNSTKRLSAGADSPKDSLKGLRSR